MIRRIPATALRPGMFVVAIHKFWLNHNYWRPRFVVDDQTMIDKMLAQGIAEVSIDVDLGPDFYELEPVIFSPMRHPPAPTASPAALPAGLRGYSRPAKISLGEERRRAVSLLREANDTVQELMIVAQIGGTVEAGRLEPLVQKMLASVGRNPDALVPLARLKASERYSAEHAVATASLIVALGYRLELPEPEIEHLALGAMLKDIGEMSLSVQLMEKPGELSSDELSTIERHVEQSLSVLEATTRLDETSIAVILEHHERFDGSGYPYRREGEAISLAGRMAAIVDTYDAMTSDRPYRQAFSPATAVQQIFGEGGRQFDAELVANFVHTVGIFPVGTLVRLESGHLGVVEAQNPGHPLKPAVRVIYHADRGVYVAPTRVDLSCRYGNHYGKIVSAEDFTRWGLSASRWAPA